ncbi:MAG: hypothetical protein H0T46_23065 [Deltaproteobacteria bacterium]|nr:hypothetical protein [Deltaproteobacteria bacterium]
MLRLLSVAVVAPALLGGCTDAAVTYTSYSCYEDETCSRDTPHGLVFQGTDITGQLGGAPGPVAIGGTQRVKVLDPSDSLTNPVPFARPYTTDTSLPSDARWSVGTEVVDEAGSVITVRGIAEGYNYLRVVAPDGDLYGRTTLSAKAVHHRQVRPPYAYGGADEKAAIVWAVGAHEMSVGLWSAPDPQLADTSDLLVDESLTLAMPGATQTRWDTISVPAAPPGHRDLVVTGGSGAVVLDVETVAAPTSIENGPSNYYPLSIYGSNQLCFVARHGTRYVAGVEWSFTMDDGQVLSSDTIDTPRSGCAYFAAHKQGTVRIHATASGFTQTLTVSAN